MMDEKNVVIPDAAAGEMETKSAESPEAPELKEYVPMPADQAIDEIAEAVQEKPAAGTAEKERPGKTMQKINKRRQDTIAAWEKSKAVRQKELQERKEKLKHTRMELNDKLKSLLSRELKEQEKKQKKRGAEILGVFAAHNFYANGFTPEELRTTLEDLGPTYVKIGQIMSSRVDLLPKVIVKSWKSCVRMLRNWIPRSPGL